MRKSLVLVLIGAAALALPGCLLVAGAAIGAGIVHVTGDDTAAVVLERDYATVFTATEAELKARGTLEAADRETGSVRGKIGSSSVEVSVKRETETSVKATVSARKNAGVSPDADTAHELATGIVKRAGS